LSRSVNESDGVAIASTRAKMFVVSSVVSKLPVVMRGPA